MGVFYKTGLRPYICKLFLANFLNLLFPRMKNYGIMVIRIVLFGLLAVVAGNAKAQFDGWGSSGDVAADTASAAPAESSFAGFGWGNEKEEAKMPERKPYVRFVPPYDSMREIIYYEGVIEDENCDYCTADSLYWRARHYIVSKFGKDKTKKFILEDIKADRITMRVTIPLIVTYGQYRKFEAGQLEYKVTLRFKDYRYKYQFGNFVHIETPNGLATAATRTYHEYYMRVKKGFQNTDQYLLAADREVKEFVAGLKKSLKEPYQPDEDDW